MQAKDPRYRERVRGIVANAPFMRELGLEFDDVGPGWCLTRLAVERRHWQQDGYIHAGVLASVADHTAGSAGFSLIAADEIILTVEFKINLLRPAVGDLLRCRADVIRAGRTLMVVESAVCTGAGEAEKLCAKATVTLAVTSAQSISA